MNASFPCSPERLAAQAPRYTSYPPAPHFTEMGEAAYRDWLAALPEDMDASLYLHIPFCRSLCWFCGCNTRISHRYAPAEAYIGLLAEEMSLVHSAIGRRQGISHIHFGGGSPTFLEPDDFAFVMDRIRRYFAVKAEADIAVEIDPRSFSEAKAACYAKLGVNRLSLGVQDFDPDVQKAIHRIQPFPLVYDTVRLCRDYGMEQISFDLIYGLPRQTEESLLRTVECAAALAPARVSLFGYAHVPWKKKNMRLIHEEELPDASLRARLFAAASQALQAAGYVPIGIDHFARADDPLAMLQASGALKRNFQGYTADAAPALIGLGASAIGQLPQGYAQNAPMIEDYAARIAEGRLATAKGFALSEDDRLRARIIERILCDLRADIPAICAQAGTEPDFSEAFAQLRALEAQGLVELQDNKLLRIHPAFPQAARLAAAAFDRYFTPQPSRHSQVA